MSERKSFENDQVKEEVLKYSDTKYTHVLMKKSDPDVCADEIWLLCENIEDARVRQINETEGYKDPDYTFYIEEITRTPKERSLGFEGRVKKYVDIDCKKVV
jgi:hypothetical protein